MFPPTDMAVLGTCFHEHAAEIDRAGFQPEWLESSVAKEVVSSILTLTRQGKVVNILNVMALSRNVPKEQWRTIIDISKNGYGDVDWRNAVNASREGYVVREVEKINNGVAVAIHDKKQKPSTWLPLLANKINSLLDTGRTADADPVSLFEKKVPSVAWTSLIPAFNNIMGGGYRDGMLMIYAGCTGHGKSTILITHAVDCLIQGKRVDVVVNELMPELFFKRILRGISGLTEAEIEAKSGSTQERDNAMKQWVAYLQTNLRVYDTEMYNAKMMERIVKWDDANVLIVDYLRGQNVDGMSRGSDPAGDMADAMLDLYRKYRIPIITAGQMSDGNSQKFIKNNAAQPAIIYGSARTQQYSTVYVGMKRDSYSPYTQYLRCWKNSFSGEMDLEERVGFNRHKGIYEIPQHILETYLKSKQTQE